MTIPTMTIIKGKTQEEIDAQIRANFDDSSTRTLFIHTSKIEFNDPHASLTPDPGNDSIEKVVKQAVRLRPDTIIFNDWTELRFYDQSFSMIALLQRLIETGHNCVIGVQEGDPEMVILEQITKTCNNTSMSNVNNLYIMQNMNIKDLAVPSI